LGISLSAVSKIEKGYRRLNQDQLIQVAELIDCSLQDLALRNLLLRSDFGRPLQQS
ncbi:MAG: helix-turn-helix transcriptional regulator, partial [Bacteroidales bacterium]|nr:helix-turn-helix transcriptional regulator [Bacteroidales bacterium]